MLIGTRHRPDDVAAGRPIEDGQADRVGSQELGELGHDRVVEPIGVEGRIDGGRERGQPAEELRPRGQALALAGEGERRRHPLSDEPHRLDVAGVEIGGRPGLDVDDADESVVDEQRER